MKLYCINFPQNMVNAFKYNAQGYDINGFDVNGFDVWGIHYYTGMPFNEYGLDKLGQPIGITNGLEFNLIKNDTQYEVAIGSAQDAHIFIPHIYNGLPVTAIADYAFVHWYLEPKSQNYFPVNNQILQSIYIPRSIIEIGQYAFYMCVALSDVVIPDSVENINQSAFSYCSALTSITLPDSVSFLGNSVFSYCTSLESVILSSHLSKIPQRTFSCCSALTSISFPPSIHSIYNNAFDSCSSLQAIFIPITVTTIDNSVFTGCPNITFYCEAPSKPLNWYSMWNNGRPVFWGVNGIS